MTPRNAACFSFSSKADTLAALAAYPDLHVPAVYAVTVEQWRADAGAAHAAALATLATPAPDGAMRVAVRSSCRREDSARASGAGAFLSVLDVPLEDAAAFADAVERVIASYGGAASDEQVLIQPMIREPAVTGVIMTRALADGAPYYVINYDDESGQTDTVTGGTHVGKTVYVYRQAREGDFDSPRLASFVALARRLEALCGTDALDIEFCLDREGVLHLLQVRPICARNRWPTSVPDARIERVADFVVSVTGPCPGLFGRRSILGVMPDWNPAEMIGILPRPLASSLYRNLITTRVWARARSGGANAMSMALTAGGVSPEQVGYINAHGTSTHLNDAGETAAVKTVFGPHAYQLAMSSTKSMTGHMLGAAGAVEAIFTALSLRDGFLPATIHYQTPDPDCDLDVVPNEGRPADIRYALSNSLGFGGHNGSLLLRKWED